MTYLEENQHKKVLMKKILFISFILAGLFSCENSEDNNGQNELTLVAAKGYYFEGFMGVMYGF